MFGMEIDVSAQLAGEEALLVAASIKDATERIEDTKKWQAKKDCVRPASERARGAF